MGDAKVKDRKWCVYIHRNNTNDKAYIGITCRNPEQRWGSGKGYTQDKQPVFYRAIQKYGWDNFEHIVWAESLTEEQAKEWEVRLIAIFKTNCCRYRNPEYGYNMTDGGEGTSGRTFSDETRRKMSETRKNPPKEIRDKISQANKNPSEETREKMSVSQKKRFSVLENNPMYGRHHTEETRSKMRGKRVSISGENNPHYGKGKHVVQLSLQGNYIAEYISAYQAELITGINRTSISRCCQHKYKMAGEYLWMYKEDYDRLFMDCIVL